MSAFAAPASRRSASDRARAAALVTVAALVLAIVALASSNHMWRVAGEAAIATAVVAAVALPRIEISLIGVVLYLGLLDGFVKLGTGVAVTAFIRDVLLYAVVVGALVRWLAARRPIPLPPLTGWILVYCATGLVQVANPSTQGITAALAGLRQHVEFVPLFLLAWSVLNSKRRLRVFLALLLTIGAINGVVSAAQFNLTPNQLAAWGPGYANRVLGTSQISIRFFVDSSGRARVRPFGLGSDQGAGGAFGLIGLAAGLALWNLERRRRRLLVGAALLANVGAIVASQSRSVVVAGVFTAIAFVALNGLSRHSLGILRALAFATVAVFLAVIFLGGGDSGAFSRYADLGSSRGIASGVSERSTVLPSFEYYLGHIPLGAGLASVGPAAVVTSGTSFNAESQFNFTLVEVGIPGLLALYALFVVLLARFGRFVRKLLDPELRMLIAAVGAPMFGLVFISFTGPITTAPPTAPFLFGAAGIAARWLYPLRPGARSRA